MFIQNKSVKQHVKYDYIYIYIKLTEKKMLTMGNLYWRNYVIFIFLSL